MAFDYEAAKAEFGVARAREMEKSSKATDAPQASSQPAAGSEAPAKKAGVGGAGWNEDFDEQWGRRVLENPKLKDMFGLSDYSSLRDEETRRQINRWLRNNQGGGAEGSAGGGASAPAATAASTVGAAKTTPATTNQPAGTTGKASLPGGLKPPPAGPAPSRTSVLAPGRLPQGVLWDNTIVPAAGGQVPELGGPWWPSYPAGGAPSTTRPGTASMQAAALSEQGGR
jgi:hypothetical protein